MFLREKTRTKEGKTCRYWSVVENRRISGRRVVQRQVLYPEEFNDNQRVEWIRTIEVVFGEESKAKQRLESTPVKGPGLYRLSKNIINKLKYDL